MIKLFLLLKRGRFQKKSHLYKRVWLMSFDIMILFYAAVFLGYIIWAFVRDGNIAGIISQFTLQMEEISIDYFWVIMTVIPIALLFRTFSRPGIMISSAEYTATMLTYTKSQIWWMAACARWVKLAIILLFIGAGLFLFSPTSGSVILLYICLLLFINIMMTIVEWRVFQLHFLWKGLILLFGIIINIVSFLTNPMFVAIGMMIVLIIVSTYLLRRVVIGIEWKKVTAACDYYLWNMFIISYMTKQKMKKDRAYTIWQRIPRWRKVFPYKKHTVYQRLWHVYWQRQFTVACKFIGGILVLVSFVPVTNHWLVQIAPLLGYSLAPITDWFFLIALALAIHMYTSFAVVIWKDRLTADIVQVLPWDVLMFQRTLRTWVICSSFIFIFPIGLYALNHWSYLFFMQMIVALYAFLYLLYWKMMVAIQLMPEDDIITIPSYMTSLGYGLLVVMILSEFFPYMSIVAMVLLIMMLSMHNRYSVKQLGANII